MGFAGDSGLYLSILVLLAIAGFFCIAGGLSAVIWTDFVQTILMVIGVLILMVLSKLDLVSSSISTSASSAAVKVNAQN